MDLSDSPLVVLDAFDIRYLDPQEFNIDCVKAYVTALLKELRPSHVVIVTSSELFPFSAPELQSLIHTIRSQRPAICCKILSQACVGFHAFLLDFAAGRANDALAIFLEMPGKIIQRCLDAIGAGIGGDGLHVQECYGFLYCTKRPREEIGSDRIIAHTAQVICQPQGVNGTLRLAKRIIDQLGLMKIGDDLSVVSFDTHSYWSTQLRASCLYWLRRNAVPVRWLPSFENNAVHFSALKPLLELETYRQELRRGPTAFVTLGAGGRIGLSVLSTKSDVIIYQMPSDSDVNREVFWFDKEIDAVQEACNQFAREHNLTKFHSAIREHLHYIDPNASRRDNTLYIWLFSESGLTANHDLDR